MSQVTFIIYSIFLPTKHRILFYLQKKHPFSCVCAIFVVSLQPKEKKNEYNTNYY